MFFTFIIGLIIGVCVSKAVITEKWTDNSKTPYRILVKKRYFKVVEIEDIDSWRMADVHRIKTHGQDLKCTQTNN